MPDNYVRVVYGLGERPTDVYRITFTTNGVMVYHMADFAEADDAAAFVRAWNGEATPHSAVVEKGE